MLPWSKERWKLIRQTQFGRQNIGVLTHALSAQENMIIKETHLALVYNGHFQQWYYLSDQPVCYNAFLNAKCGIVVINKNTVLFPGKRVHIYFDSKEIELIKCNIRRRFGIGSSLQNTLMF